MKQVTPKEVVKQLLQDMRMEIHRHANAADKIVDKYADRIIKLMREENGD